MKRVLVTGAAGFAGSHLLDLLGSDSTLEVVGWRRPGEPIPADLAGAPVHWEALDVLDRDAVAAATVAARPDIVYHLAGAAHVGAAWANTAQTLAVNALGTHHVVESLVQAGLAPRLLIPSSAYVYRPSNAAIDEQAAVHPNTPYGFSKLAQELVGLEALEQRRLPVIVARAFNHVGPRQEPSFATSSFARQIAVIEAGATEPVIHVGNLAARRDLTDVRDTVRAYRVIAERGAPGRTYNVCSGIAYPVGDVLHGLLRIARVPIDVRVDAARLRPNDTPVFLGDRTRLTTELGWHPEIPFDQTLCDLLDYWRRAVTTR